VLLASCVCVATADLAAAHPLPYFSLIDCCCRSGMDAEHTMLAVAVLRRSICEQPPAAMLQGVLLLQLWRQQ
jgi:hypothetical protein